jgi:hypothetical protein
MPAEEKKVYAVRSWFRNPGEATTLPKREMTHNVVAEDMKEAGDKVEAWFKENNTRGVFLDIRFIENVTANYGVFLM